MPDLISCVGLLASGENFDKFKQMGSELRRRTTEGTGDDLALLAIVATVVPLFVVALYVLVKLQEKHENLKSPKALFRELCRAHGLDRASRNLLAQLALRHDLTDPARLFLEPERFDMARLGPGWQDKVGLLDSLRARLFARERTAALAPQATRGETSIRNEEQFRETAAAAPIMTASVAQPISFAELAIAASAPMEFGTR